MSADIIPGKKEEGGETKYATVFYIPADAAVEAQRILDILRSKNNPPVDPKVIQDEAEDLWGKTG